MMLFVLNRATPVFSIDMRLRFMELTHVRCYGKCVASDVSRIKSSKFGVV